MEEKITRNIGSKFLKPDKNYKPKELRISANLKHEKYIKETTQRYIIIKLHITCNKENILKAYRKEKDTLQWNKDKEEHRFLVKNNVNEKTIKQ